MSWNRTYRPRAFSELHLTNVREYGSSLLNAAHIPQVFLFTGPKGTGKTSTSRILGAVLNDPANAETVKALFFEKKKPKQPLTEPADSALTEKILAGNSYVVHELDAASNRGIDEVRSLRERVMLPPSEGVMSVFILDEVHMLTTEAFNALLKLLEEPPPHVIFVLATTEKEKLPDTIISRCQVVQFRQATNDELVTALQQITNKEKISVTDEVLFQVAERAEGSFRDAVKLLEMIVQMGEGSITDAALESVLSLSVGAQIEAALSALLAKDAAGVVTAFQTLRLQNVQAKYFHKALLMHLYQDLLRALGIAEGTATYPQATSSFLLRELAPSELSLPAPIVLLPLELKFLELIERSQKKRAGSGGSANDGEPTQTRHTTKAATSSKSASTRASEHAEQTHYTTDVITAAQPVSARSTDTDPKTAPTTATSKTTFAGETIPKTGNQADGAALCARWSEFVELTKEHNFGLATLLNSAKPIAGEIGVLTLSVFYTFHKEQLLQPKFRAALQDMCEIFIGGSVELECVLTPQPDSAELSEVPATDTLTELAVASLM